MTKKGVSTICIDYYSIYKYDNLLIYTFTSQNEYSETDIIRMVEFLIDNTYVEFGGHVYQQTVGIPMVTNCDPFVADLFLYHRKLCCTTSPKRVSSETKNILYSHLSLLDYVLSLNNS